MPAIYDGEPGALGLALTNFSSREKSGDVAPCQEEIGDGGTLGKKYCTWGGEGGENLCSKKGSQVHFSPQVQPQQSSVIVS